MELKHLLSIAVATLTALGAMLYAMGLQSAALAVGLWFAAILSLVVTDFLGVFRLRRNIGSILMWFALVAFAPEFIFQSWEGRLHTVANILICLQISLLFQDKDARVYGWLAVMSLLQAVVAARYSRGVDFGSLLVVYTIVGILALSLLALYAQWGHKRDAASPAKPAAPPGRWPLAGMRPEFTSTPPVVVQNGVVPEYFGRLALIALGGLILATVIFYTIPRPRGSSFRFAESNRMVALVGFNDHIDLGGLGDMIESREEVLKVKLLDAATREPYPMHEDIYLRGEMVTYYSQNQWRRLPPPGTEGDRRLAMDDPESSSPSPRIGTPVIQQSTIEPFTKGDTVFYLWPLIKADENQGIHFAPQSERLLRFTTWEGEVHPNSTKFEVTTAALLDHHQLDLVPARLRLDARHKKPLLELPDEGLPRLTELAGRWRQEAGLKTSEHYDIARHFEQQLSSSGQFEYSLEGQKRDQSIDAIEDFVSNHPRGHCEYFATALALMLRSQGIPSRVILGYRCDEYDPQTKTYQVRQLHAHAWVEAYLGPEQIPPSLWREKPETWANGGWLRLDGTPAADVGSTAANKTVLGAWEARWHAMQHYWDNYIADMDRTKQQESIYEPIRRAVREFFSRVFSPTAWVEFFLGVCDMFQRAFASGIVGKIFGTLLLIVLVGLPALFAWWIVRRAIRLWRRIVERRRARAAQARSTVEFYHGFEQLAARCGLLRTAGQTPREFARAAGKRLASISGRPELLDRAVQLVEEFYRVRFGRQTLDPDAAQAIQKTLDELKAGAEVPRAADTSS